MGLRGVEEVVEEGLAGMGSEQVEFVEDEDDGFGFPCCGLVVIF